MLGQIQTHISKFSSYVELPNLKFKTNVYKGHPIERCNFMLGAEVAYSRQQYLLPDAGFSSTAVGFTKPVSCEVIGVSTAKSLAAMWFVCGGRCSVSRLM